MSPSRPAVTIGRTEDLAEIVAALEDSEPHAFLIAGPMGVGKTHLMREAGRLAAARGFALVRVAATRASASIPFGPFAHLLPDPEGSRFDRLALLGTAIEGIFERAGPGRPLLTVDDAHLLDNGSAALVHQVANRRLCHLVATLRTGAPAPDSVTSLWKDGLAKRIDLQPLSESEVGALAANLAGAPLSGAARRRLWQLSGGNAMYLRELVAGAIASGDLIDDDGVFVLQGHFSAPERLVELVAGRMEAWPADVLEVVDLLAVAGNLGVVILGQLVSPEAIEAAERMRAVEVLEHGRRYDARLGHPVYGEIRRQSMPHSQARRLAASLAKALAETGARRRDDLLRIAHWQLDAGIKGDPGLFARAAKKAKSAHDFALANRLARAAIDAGAGVETGLVLAETEFLSGNHEEAERILADLAGKCENDDEVILIAGARAYNLSALMGDPARAVGVLGEAMSAVTDKSRLVVRSATISMLGGWPADALATADMALPSGEDLVVASAERVRSTVLAQLGRTGEALEAAERGLVVHRRLAESNQIPETQLIGVALAHAGAGHFDLAQVAATAGYDATLEADDDEGTATFGMLMGCVLADRGALGDAAASFREAVAINRKLNDTGALRWCLGGTAWVAGMAGDTAAALAAVEELGELRDDWMAVFGPDLVERGRAWERVAAGDISSARAILSAAAADAASRSMLISEARLRHDLARLGEPRRVTARLAELAGLVDGDLVPLFAEHAKAMAADRGEALAEVSSRLAAIGAGILAAEAAAAASTAYRAEGLMRQSMAWARVAAEGQEASGARTPRLQVEEVFTALSSREYEIAVLAARGQSNREIADKLFISVRTVETHVRNIFIKLGATNREQLRERLDLPGPW